MKCACQSADARMCYVVRYDIDPADDDLDDGRCECPCHTDEDFDDSEAEWDAYLSRDPITGREPR